MLPFYLQLLETEGEKQKFERLYERYRRLMHWIAVGILQDEHLAEDAVHEAFLRILQNFDGIDEILSPKTRNFVVIVVRNTSLNLRKKQKREDETLVKDVFSEEERQGQGDQLQTVIENLSYGFDETADAVCRQEIIDAVLSMPDTLKEILMMYGYVGYNIHEIADYLNITEDAAYKRLRRARNALAKRIEGGQK